LPDVWAGIAADEPSLASYLNILKESEGVLLPFEPWVPGDDTMRRPRERLSDEISESRAEISHLLAELSRFKWPTHRRVDLQRLGNAQRSNAGRPASLQRLVEELKLLRQAKSWLHATLIELRGEHVFAPGSGTDRLAQLGIIAAPSEPVSRGRGRPTGRHKEERWVWLACWALMLGRRKANTLTPARARKLAAECLWPELNKEWLASDFSKAIRHLKNAGNKVADLWLSLQPESKTEK